MDTAAVVHFWHQLRRSFRRVYQQVLEGCIGASVAAAAAARSSSSSSSSSSSKQQQQRRFEET
jgi:hypothetical protein